MDLYSHDHFSTHADGADHSTEPTCVGSSSESRRPDDDDGGHHDIVAVRLDIPAAIDCAPERAWIVGGAGRIHPTWSLLSIEPDVAAAPTPHWGVGTVTSVDSPSSVTFHRRGSSFEAFSVKTGRAHSGLGPHEQARWEELNVDPDIVEFDLQGLRCDWTGGPTYLLDYHALHATRGLIAGEIKADRSWFLDPDYAPTMANARRSLGAVGITFTEVSASDENANQTRRRNVRRAYCDRFTAVTSQARDAVREELAREREVPLARVRTILSNDARTAQRMVHALLCRRLLAYDLDRPVGPKTIVREPTQPRTSVDIRHLELSEAD